MTDYFDYAAATPMLPEVAEAMRPYFSDKFYNPSALYLAAQDVKKDLKAARETIARELGAKSTEIIFTAGGTEANNLAILGITSSYADAHVVTSAVEHDSVLQPIRQLNHSIAGVDEKGLVAATEIDKNITDKTVLVSVMLVNNEIGSIQDIRAIAGVIDSVRRDRMARGIERPIYLHTDACQATNYLDIHISRLGVDLLTINAGKIYGPKQSGALFVKTGVQLAPIIRGGGQERNLRSGTENVAYCVGFARAVQLVRSTLSTELKRLEPLQAKIIAELTKDPRIHLNGPAKKRRLVNNIHITIDGFDNERLLMGLDERNILVATGSACSASHDEPSHVLKAIGLSDKQAQSSLRITLGRHTTPEQCDQLIKSIQELVAKD